MRSVHRLVALDIETTGLDPHTGRLVAAGLASSECSEPRLSRDEALLLKWLETKIGAAPEGTVLVTWNGEEFDLPFLSERFRARGIPTSLKLRRRGLVGKYGKPRYKATWGRVPHLDISNYYKRLSEERSIPWNLKPVAQSVLGVEPIMVDNRGKAIAMLDDQSLKAYLQSDIQITHALASRIPPSIVDTLVP